MTSSADPTSTDFRPEIQALRALAVVAVVAFHFWPTRLPGGYAGVDVFFVISGYLITSHLLREAAHHGRIRITAFWARRIRRLLPASLLVLVVTTAAILLVAPAALWPQFLREVVASALYVENWSLAADSVDYLAAENASSPVQHYWSLSAEEQFYLVWPLLVAAGLLLAARRTSWRAPAVIAALLGTVTVASLVVSIVMTQTNPNPAYFVTPTRAWEFGAGALLAFVPRAILDARLRPAPAAALAWIGLAAIGAAFVFFSAETPFPGWAALLPVGGTVAVLAAGGSVATWSPTRILGWRPVQYVGDISYSLYLWHWPVLVLLPWALGRDPGTLAKGAAVVGCLLLAALTKRFIEDRGRRTRYLVHARPRRTLIAMGAAMALTVATPVGVVAALQLSATEDARTVEAAIGDPCVGAAALAEGADCPTGGGELLLDRSRVLDDGQGAYSCYDTDPGAELMSCTIGSEAPDAVRIAVIGDSHGAMLIPPLRDVAAQRGWRVDTFVGRGCVWTQGDLADTADACHARNAAMNDRLVTGEPYDLVILAARRSLDVPAGEPVTAFATAGAAWQSVAERGTVVVALVDNPLVPPDLVDCVIGARSDEEARGCAIPEDEAYRLADGLTVAAEEHGIPVIDLGRYYCRDGICPMIIGDVPVYRDRDHLTGTYARTLAPYLADVIDATLAGR